MKAAIFFFTGLVIAMGVVGGIEQTVDFTLLDVLQLAAMSAVAFAMMSIGVSHAQE